MREKGRKLELDIFDYRKNKICSLYNQMADVSGQAYDVVVTTERNGWKELSFSIPSRCIEDGGSVDNFRIPFLKADYRIRLTDDKGEDWFLISEPKIVHSDFQKNVTVTAGHISQLLKTKNLGLEFSDDEGNNVGTAGELLATILDGTGWMPGNVSQFYEKDGLTVKYRSLKASAKTGAFKLISNMCDLFDAKPVYRCENGGDDKYVDIMPINPFSEPKDGQLPDVSKADGVIELHYGRNVKNVTRTLNTENLVTRLYAYGSYGDKTDGYCGIDECYHTEYILTATSDIAANLNYYFTVRDDDAIDVSYTITPDEMITKGSELVFSLLDPASQMYVWNRTSQKAYPTTKGKTGSEINASQRSESKQNWFSFIMDYRYYRDIGLLSDDIQQTIAAYQQNAPKKYEEIQQASLEMSESQTSLSEIIGSVHFCRLAIASVDKTNAYLSLRLDKGVYEDGVMYRTDYDKKKKDRFEWRTTPSVDENGDPKNKVASMLFIVHDTNPITWDKAYLKELDDEKDPSVLTFWAERTAIDIYLATDRFFLFELNNINGALGAFESSDEAALLALDESTKAVTAKHPVYFSKTTPILDIDALNGYGWWWQYNPTEGKASTLYFCYSSENDSTWNAVTISDNDPGSTFAKNNTYWFDWKSSILYRRNVSAWVRLETDAEEKVAALFGTVLRSCLTRDRYYKGLWEKYIYTCTEDLPVGNYFFKSEYDVLWVFSTKKALKKSSTVTFDTTTAKITTKSDVEETLEAMSYRYDNVKYHEENVLDGILAESGTISTDTGSPSDNSAKCRLLSFANVYPNTTYLVKGITGKVDVHMYDSKDRWLGCTKQISGTNGNFTTIVKNVSSAEGSAFDTTRECKKIKLAMSFAKENYEVLNPIVVAKDRDNSIIIDDVCYYRLGSLSHDGDRRGILAFVKKFRDLADETYETHYSLVKSRQDAVNELENNMLVSLGDMYREGYWQKVDYVDGDETKLYTDALEKLVHIAKPEAKYDIGFLDLYDSNKNDSAYGVDEETMEISWPDLSISSAVHLIDPEIDINVWAFIDKIRKCYDCPWKTTLSINTNLTTMAQHSFTDVMTHIADVTQDLVGKTSKYDNTPNASIVDGMLIDGSQLINGSIDGLKIENGSITSIKIGTAEITTANIQNAAITNAKIANASIDNAKIANASISTAKIADAAITNAKIENASITTAKIETGAITTALIATGAVQSAQIADASITDAKIVELSANRITTGTLSVERLVLLGDEKSLIYSINNAIINGATTDEEARKAVSCETIDGGTLTDKTVTADKLVAKSITAAQIASESITANEIATNAIKAANIDVADLTASDAFVGALTTDKIMSTLGGSLDLSSNQSIQSTVSSVVEETYEDMQNTVYQKVDDLIGYRIDILSDTVFLTNSKKETTLTARVFHGSSDVTDTFDAALFAWYRDSDDELSDGVWNEKHKGMKHVVVTAADVLKQASFRCELADREVV